jgi:hypothetical protein
MHFTQRYVLCFCWLLVFSLIPACTPNGSSTPTQTGLPVSVADIKADYTLYAGQLVSVRGFGIIVMSVPLCPGYSGMDTRMNFVDQANNTIPCVVTAPGGKAERGETVREFQGYVRVYSGEIGCPGSVQSVTFPFFEIVTIK